MIREILFFESLVYTIGKEDDTLIMYNYIISGTVQDVSL